MKRYVSLASALLVGTVVANKKFSVAEPVLVSANDAAPIKEFKVAVALEANKPVYASDVSDLNDDIQDVKANGKPERKSNVSSNTSARQVDVNRDKKSSAKSAQSSATSARVAAKDSTKSDKQSSKKDGAKSNSVSSATTPEGVEEVDTSVTSNSKYVEAVSSVETSNTSDNQKVENSVDSKETSAATSKTSENQNVENSVDTSNSSDDQKVEALDETCSSATSNNQVEAAESSIITTPEVVEVYHQTVSCNSDAQQDEAVFADDNERSVSSSGISGARGMNTSTYSEVSSTPEGFKEDDDDLKSQNNQNITDKDIEDMLMNVKAVEHGFLGDCGVFYKIALGDTYQCFDKQENVIAYCNRDSLNPTHHIHLCCTEGPICDDWLDNKPYNFGPVLQ